MHAYVCVRVCVCVWIYICLYLFIYFYLYLFSPLPIAVNVSDLITVLVVTLCRILTISHLKPAMFLGYRVCSCSVFTVFATRNVILHVEYVCTFTLLY